MEKQCQTGTPVLNVAECKVACGFLVITKLGVFKEGRPCYKGGNGVCNQNVKKPGNRATRICKGIEVQKSNVFWSPLDKYVLLKYNLNITSLHFRVVGRIPEDTVISLNINSMKIGCFTARNIIISIYFSNVF